MWFIYNNLHPCLSFMIPIIWRKLVLPPLSDAMVSANFTWCAQNNSDSHVIICQALSLFSMIRKECDVQR